MQSNSCILVYKPGLERTRDQLVRSMVKEPLTIEVLKVKVQYYTPAIEDRWGIVWRTMLARKNMRTLLPRDVVAQLAFMHMYPTQTVYYAGNDSYPAAVYQMSIPKYAISLKVDVTAQKTRELCTLLATQFSNLLSIDVLSKGSDPFFQASTKGRHLLLRGSLHKANIREQLAQVLRWKSVQSGVLYTE